MANVFLSGEDRDIDTAILLDRAIRHDIGKAVACTDGDRVFLNTDDNLYKILPNYNNKMLKWLLWHEEYHNQLRHHNRYFKYLHELKESECIDKFQVTKEEVNIIMDILVHDSLCKLFPDIVEIAKENLAQLRDRNSLKYTFKTHTLEEMLDEYRDYKKAKDEKDKGEDKKEKSEEKEKSDEKEKDSETTSKEKAHKKDETKLCEKSKPKDKEDEDPEETEKEDTPSKPQEEVDWSKLEDRDDKEFITVEESREITDAINEIKRTKLKLAQVTETLNGLVTSSRKRTYARPNPIKLSGGAILKGSIPGKSKLYLCFDASGSMSEEINMFKEIISKSIPQAMECPCEWFTYEYHKGKFKDIMGVRATSGFDDDGDRTIELCWKAEQAGYSPIGVTDGGGGIYWAEDKLKQLRRTVLVGDNRRWLEKAKKINPMIQIIVVD